MQGHESTIEDVVFKPGSKEQLASVGDDQCLLLWDTRSGTAPATRVAKVCRAPGARRSVPLLSNL